MTGHSLRSVVAVLLLAVTGLAGCGKSTTTSVSGTVKFKDGKPVPRGTVVFDSGERLARGNINPDGSFKLDYTNDESGAPPGTYAVYILGAVEPKPGSSDSTPLIAQKYTTSGSGIKHEVKAGEANVFNIEVEAPN